VLTLLPIEALTGVTEGERERQRSVVFLMTCHSRRDTTLASLAALAAQEFVDDVLASVVLVDDGSTDGTAEAVSTCFPDVTVVPADGSLFWSRGMALAQAAALRHIHPDYLCWVNDDVRLDAAALATLLHESRESRSPSVVVGATVDPRDRSITYSGFARMSRSRPKSLELVDPAGRPRRVDTFNGNFVLVPRAVYEAIGGVDEAFAHGLGDIDYGYRVSAQGFSSTLARTPVGTCARNSVAGTWQDAELTVAQRLRLLSSAKGLPFSSQVRFYERHGHRLWPVRVVAAYVTSVATICATYLKR